MKRCNSQIALMLGTVITMLVIQDYAATSNLSEGFDTAPGAADVVLFSLGLLSLGVVRNRRNRRQGCTKRNFPIAWLVGQEPRFENRLLKEIEQR